ncbi:hypothetical protein ZOSMA_93G00050 [Zostera marina]|uniref:Uncharacterized protein n=1 Tax=Zostera marina TaxID=29655 RepID=A0A0K9NIF0_ZOSMR|nr:hypothetical protein ZOSMA_93G00050 [Zostera marina]
MQSSGMLMERCRRNDQRRWMSDSGIDLQELGYMSQTDGRISRIVLPGDDGVDAHLIDLTLEPHDDADEEGVTNCSSTAPTSSIGIQIGSSSTSPSLSPGRSEDMSARDRRKAQARLERTRSGAERALQGLRFISITTECVDSSQEMWSTVENSFDVLSHDGLLSRDDFGECIGMVETKEFAKGVFDALVRRRKQNVERINKEELYDFWIQITDQSFDARLQIFFDMVDTNVDGRITRDEVQQLIELSASANNLSKLKEQAAEYASLIMEELDPENLGYIEIWQLEALLLQRDRYMNNSRSLSTRVRKRIVGGTSGGLIRAIRSFSRSVVIDNWQRLWVVMLWIAAMVGVFVWKFIQYRRHSAFHVMGYCLPTAKAAAETLKLNMAIILFPVCRNTITWLRSTAIRLVVPFDDNINFHKIIATAITGGVILHAGNHLTCDFPRIVDASPTEYISVSRELGEHKPTLMKLMTGIEGMTGITMVVLMAIAFTLATSGFRKNGVKLPYHLNKLTGFNAFWYSHHLLAIVYVLLIFHGYYVILVHKWYKKTTWMYIAVPLLLYLGERSLRSLRSESYTVKILKVSILPGDMLTMVMTKPHGFRYRSGQYVFLKCRSISPFEWHPFSITSAPGDEHLSVHIRTIGDWTQQLRRVFTEKPNFPNSGNTMQQKSLPRLLIDGPYGAPAQNYSNYDVLLLVGLGIGATPFISILRDLVNNTKIAEYQSDSNTDISRSDDILNYISNGSSTKRRAQRASNAYFYWVTRNPNSLDWFKGVMNQVAEIDQKVN